MHYVHSRYVLSFVAGFITSWPDIVWAVEKYVTNNDIFDFSTDAITPEEAVNILKDKRKGREERGIYAVSRH